MTEVDNGIIRRVLIVCNLSYDMGKDVLNNNVEWLLNLSCKEDMNDYIENLEKNKLKKLMEEEIKLRGLEGDVKVNINF